MPPPIARCAAEAWAGRAANATAAKAASSIKRKPTAAAPGMAGIMNPPFQ
ncbi:hypothetical protein CTATCC11996_13735 [Comamonas testosteroni ATCC 11996]|nr:hypothetical protein CTATCC11996_13735 [Comamonas testosteroni ATCC 11996]